jgi:serine/threonine-protein kinase HipA
VGLSTQPTVLQIFLEETLVGTIVALHGRETVFTFDDSYVENDDRPTLSRGFIDAYGRLHVRPGRVGRIIPFFANLLPEGDLRDYIAARAGIDKRDDLALLWLAGSDLPGAVIARDTEGRPIPPPVIGGPAAALPTDRLFRFSLAGVQLKFSAMHNACGGLSIAVNGRDGESIVKLPSTHFSRVPENEYAMMMFAADVGLKVPECRLVDLADIAGLPTDIPRGVESRAFVIRRFDRDGGRRIQIEDFNQIYRQYPTAKYDNHDYNEMAKDMYRWMGVDALREFVHRLVFTMAIGNSDMHLKNWSLIYPDGRTPELAPCYDYVCTTVYDISGRNELGLKLGAVKAFSQIDEAMLEYFAKRADVAPRIVVTAAREMRDRILSTWPQYSLALREELPFVYDRIGVLLSSIPFFKGKPLHAVAAGVEEEAPSEHQEID